MLIAGGRALCSGFAGTERLPLWLSEGKKELPFNVGGFRFHYTVICRPRWVFAKLQSHFLQKLLHIHGNAFGKFQHIVKWIDFGGYKSINAFWLVNYIIHVYRFYNSRPKLRRPWPSWASCTDNTDRKTATILAKSKCILIPCNVVWFCSCTVLSIRQTLSYLKLQNNQNLMQKTTETNLCYVCTIQ